MNAFVITSIYYVSLNLVLKRVIIHHDSGECMSLNSTSNSDNDKEIKREREWALDSVKQERLATY